MIKETIAFWCQKHARLLIVLIIIIAATTIINGVAVFAHPKPTTIQVIQSPGCWQQYDIPVIKASPQGVKPTPTPTQHKP